MHNKNFSNYIWIFFCCGGILQNMTDKYDSSSCRRCFSIGIIDKFLHNLHTSRSGFKKLVTIAGSLLIYAAVILIFGNFLKVSSNYFIIIPLIAFSFSFGFIGGILSGLFALPLNLLMFYLLGHSEYSPESKLIAELTGIIIGTCLGYLSDYYNEIEVEIERRRIAEERLQQSLVEKDILFHEIHHRVKNNLNIIKSLIQLQINRSENQEFINEAEKLIRRIFSIATVHEKLHRDRRIAKPVLNEYVPSLVADILSGIDDGNLAVSYRVDIPETLIDIEQATSLGLIINEVLTNAVKYSLSLVESPELEVILKSESGKIVIELVNNAPTFLPGKDDYNGLGLRLINTLCKQLDAEYAYLPGNGTTFRLVLPE